MSTHPGSHACPWWLIFTFDNPLRKWIHDPRQILAAYVRPGDTVLDVGCGMGYFTLPLARLVGPAGRVIAADLQPQMLAGLRRRAARAGLLDRIQLHPTRPDRLGLDRPLDFILAFWMVHEVRQPEAFWQETYAALRSGGRLLIVEPGLHVGSQAFENSIQLAERQGFSVPARPQVRFSRAALLAKPV